MKLHSLHISHGDIKPDNIGWSNEKNKLVYLDFGFARYIREPIGEKTKTHFIGTYSYTLEEMKKAYILKQKNFVDIYYNDVFGLEKTIS